jgi:hypothetical protein
MQENVGYKMEWNFFNFGNKINALKMAEKVD